MPAQTGTARHEETLAALAVELRGALIPLVRQLRRHNVDLSAPQVAALATLERNGAQAVGELARLESVTSPMVTKVAKSLEELGLVTRSPDEADRRVCLIAITGDGRRRLDTIRSAKNAWLARRLGSLSAEELTAIETVIPLIERLTADASEPMRAP
ncbi:MAG: MarR family transcriptional regulator [Acidimicrobiia bacterium]